MSKYSRLNPEQKSALEAALVNNCYLDKDTLMQLTKETGLDEVRIRQWFNKGRCHIRKGRKEFEGTISNSEYF